MLCGCPALKSVVRRTAITDEVTRTDGLAGALPVNERRGHSARARRLTVMNAFTTAPRPGPSRLIYALLVVMWLGTAMGIYGQLAEPFTGTVTGFLGRLFSPMGMTLLMVGRYGRGRAQQIGMVLGAV